MDKNQVCEAYGFIKDEDKKIFDKIFNGNKISEINIDTYIDEPFMLFSRIKEKNVITKNVDGRIIFSKSDRHKTHIVSILFDKIKNCQLSIVNLQLARDKLLPKLMNGEIEV